MLLAHWISSVETFGWCFSLPRDAKQLVKMKVKYNLTCFSNDQSTFMICQGLQRPR